MLSKLPANLDKVDPDKIDQQILRAGIIAELDAVSFYEQMAAMAKDPKIKKVLLDIAKEEKEHVGELEELLDQLDKEHVKAVKEGREEVKELTKE